MLLVVDLLLFYIFAVVDVFFVILANNPSAQSKVFLEKNIIKLKKIKSSLFDAKKIHPIAPRKA